MNGIKMGRFALLIACCSTLTSVFAQQVSPVAAPAVEDAGDVQSVVQELMNRMETAIQKSKTAKDTKLVDAVITDAAKVNIPDADFASLVGMAVKAFPDKIAPLTQHAVIASGGAKATPGRVLTVMQTAISSHPKPFSAVLAVRDSVLQVVGSSPVLATHVREGALAMAEYAPDNPLSPVAVESKAADTPASSLQHTVTTEAGGSRILPVDGVPFVPEPLLPASSTDGSRN